MRAPRPLRALLLVLLSLQSYPAAAQEIPGLLYDEVSPFERVVVVDEGGQRFLRFGSLTGDDQTVLDLARPDIPVLEYIPRTGFGMALLDAPDRALVIGLGGGSTTRFWHGIYPAMRIDSVEIDPLVVAVAFQYFGFPFDLLLPVHVMDGRAWVRESPGEYDLVLLDAYGAGDAPYHLTTLDYYAELRAKLAPGAVVVANMVAEENNTVAAMARTFREAFPTVYRIETPNDGNVLLIGTDGPQLTEAELAVRLEGFVAAHAPGMDPADLGRPSPSPGNVHGAPVLRDRTTGTP
ncbi:MAG: fused MFS/spermidine synthase [Myxococcota bacterium]|nr:fused MFS/spermidine synthase [Myxococcota bacterium]